MGTSKEARKILGTKARGPKFKTRSPKVKWRPKQTNPTQDLDPKVLNKPVSEGPSPVTPIASKLCPNSGDGKDMAVLCSEIRYIDSIPYHEFSLNSDLFQDVDCPATGSVVPLEVLSPNDEADSLCILAINEEPDSSPSPISSEMTLIIQLISVSAEWSEAQIHSSWVIQNIRAISQMLGVSYDGFEDRALALFAELDRRNAQKTETSPQTNKGKKKQQVGGSRELKQLQCSINYDRIEGHTEGANAILQCIKDRKNYIMECSGSQ